MRDKGAIAIAAASLAFAGSAAFAKTISVAAGNDAQTRLQEALISAAPGDVVELEAGRFKLTDGLSLDVPKVTVRGKGSGQTILDFTGQLGAGEGFQVGLHGDGLAAGVLDLGDDFLD